MDCVKHYNIISEKETSLKVKALAAFSPQSYLPPPCYLPITQCS